MSYKDKTLSSPEYGGRVSFGFKDSRSGGLASGDVSMKVTNVTLQDSGDYRCYVSSDQSHGNEIVSLVVTGECDEKCKNHLMGWTNVTTH